MSINRKYYSRPRQLGQYFLINQEKLRKIAAALDFKPDETIVEIGPGHGELTELITGRIIAIEKDERLANYLKQKFSVQKNIEIISGDALKILPKLEIKNYKLVGNIPFYLTGYLLRIIGELENKPLLIVFTLQKEVAERICSQPPKMNLLAASVQFWAEPKIIDYISKKDFQPQPKVDSAVIELKSITLGLRSQTKCYKENYYRLIKILFKQPRKTILNNLATSLEKNKEEIIKILEASKIKPSDRPQDLTLEQIKNLTCQSS